MIKTKIMIVEDEVITAMSLQHLLEHWGYEMCEQVSSGREAIEKAGREKPDIVLIDINLNGEISGIEAARQIRSLFCVPIIFITGYSDKETIKEAKHAEPAGYFVKPLDFKKLKLTIDSVVHKDKGKLRGKKDK
jgi:CheY-like chemotaxis protein